MIETLTTAAKIKALVAILSLLFLGSVYETQDNNEISMITQQNKDTFVSDIQVRANLVNNTVQEAITTQGTMHPLQYKQTCETSLAYIRQERLDTDIGYNALDPSKKELIDKYRLYLDESANVVMVSMAGEQPDTSELIRLKNELF